MNRGRQQFIIFAFGFVLAFVLLLGAGFIVGRFASPDGIYVFNYQLRPKNVAAKKKIFVVSKRINKSEQFPQESFKPEERDATQVPLDAVIDANFLLDKYACINLEPNTVVAESMVISAENAYSPDDRLKDYEIPATLITQIVKEGDLIDVELVRNGGQTLTVLSKKRVKNKVNNRVIVQVAMAERNNINSALAEQIANQGHIEAVVYLDETQAPSIVNYGSGGNGGANR